MTSARRARRSFARTLAFYGALALVVVVLAFLAGHLASGWAVRRELRAWEATGSSMDALRAHWPRRADSPAALELDRLVRPLGLHLTQERGTVWPIDNKAEHQAMGKWLGELYKSTDDRYEAAPAEVRAFLDAHRADLAAVAAHLRSATDITWATNIDAGPEAPLPGLLAHRYLSTMLLSEALERNRRGDVAGSEEMLDAAWRQGETLASRPELISQLIAIALAGQHGNVLRRVAGASPSWEERLKQRRFLPGVIGSFQSDAYGFVTVAQSYRGTSDADARVFPAEGAAGSAVRVATAPWIRLSLSSASRHLRRSQELARAADACRVKREDLDDVVASGIGRWDVIARVAVPSVMRSVTAGAGADLDSELTRLVLQARHGGATADVPSTVCKSVTWHPMRESDGRRTIRAEPPLEVDPARPHRWTFTLAAGSSTLSP
jgi:hypothetical protein